MRRRTVVALLTSFLLFAAGLVHSAFACSAARHAAASAPHRHCKDAQSSPPCCGESASALALANDRADREAVGARVITRPVVAVGIPSVPLRVAALERVAARIAFYCSAADSVPQHLRYRSLLL
jgi:hypothetical protein